MTLILDAALRSWPFDPWLMAGLILTAIVYLRGWRVYARRDPARWPWTKPAAFLAGLAAIFLALASPIEPFASLLLSVHMVQHLLLMMVAPPLLWLGTPLLPMLRGWPEPVRLVWIAPLFRLKMLRRIAARITHPVFALPIFLVTTWGWHTPSAYDLALRSPLWHYLQHACFLGSGLLFWFPVVRPYPYRPTWPLWYLLPYLLIADVSNTILSALLTFSDRLLYESYASVPRFNGGTTVEDQAVAGVLMWVPGSLVFLSPLVAIGLRWLSGDSGTGAAPVRKLGATVQHGSRFELKVLAAQDVKTSPDVLRLPLLGPFLRWRHSRLALQVPMFALAMLVVVDGFLGPDVSPMNLAGVLPWIHWRGLLVLALVVGGNLFCTACPFMLPRTLARRFLPVGFSWPRRLRTKWLALALLVVFFTAYEAFSLWDQPRATAIIILAYFAGAFAVDSLFRGASFCKYVCPIGQFNFVQSLASPLEIAVRDPSICGTCRTKDCIRGRDSIPGCELGLYLPRKQGNMDCTFCLDCVHACPHGNIGLLAVVPGRTLLSDPFRSGIGRFSQRTDLAALVLVLVFAAFANAAGMVGPVIEMEAALQQRLNLPSTMPIAIGFSIVALLIAPLAMTLFAAGLCREWGRLPGSLVSIASRFAYTLIPLGFAMWIAHYGFHLATSYDSAWPTLQRFALDHGLHSLGEPSWTCGCCTPPGGWLIRVELLALDVGLLATLYLMLRTAEDLAPRGRAFLASLPWAALAIGLFAVGVWVLLQPMQMRGTMMG